MMKKTLKVLSLMLCLAMVISLFPCMEAGAASAEASIEFGSPKLENNIVTFPEATVTCNFPVYTITVNVTDGSIKTTGYSNADLLTNHKTATWQYSSS